MTDLSGQYLGRYYLTERLGEGGMAVVYKAYDTRLERDVAVKIIRSVGFPSEELDQILKRFEREAKSLAKLSHPNIVKVYDYGEHEGAPYLVMEYLPGGTLKKMLGNPVPWQDAVRLLLPIARGVAYAHQRGILHRDIKPANILITDGGEPMLSDFGIAKLFEGDQTTALTGSGMAIGTPEYMAPEQWTGTTSPQSDLYSLGIVLYEMIAGRKPYVADTPAAILIKQATEPLPSPRKFAVDLPEAMELVLIKTLAKEPADRYRDMKAIITALENLHAGMPVTPPEHLTVEETYRIPATKPVVQVDGETVHTVSAAYSQKVEESHPPSALVAKTRSPIQFSRIGVGILIGGIMILLSIWLGSTLIGKLNASTPDETVALTLTSPLDAPSMTIEPSQTPPEIITPAMASLPIEITDARGVEMLLVTAGEFTMGSNRGEPDESPTHNLYLDSYYLDKYEITNELYKACVDVGVCLPPLNNGSNSRTRYYENAEFNNYPVVYVTWDMAQTYCKWRGGRLPTEAEWEKALRGEAGDNYVSDIQGNMVNFCDRNCPLDWADQNYDDGYPDTAPKDAYPEAVSPYGFYNLSGNVWEWTQDWYGAGYYQSSPAENPTGPTSGIYRVIRGGSYGDILDYTRVTRRSKFDPSKTTSTLGFRCALTVVSTASQSTVAQTSTPEPEPGFTIVNPQEVLNIAPDLKALGQLSVEKYSTEDRNRINSTLTFTVNSTPDVPILWRWFWCAVNRDVLEQNMNKISLIFDADGYVIPKGQLATVVFENADSTYKGWMCRTYETVLRDWKPGTYTLTQTMTISSAINDGKDAFEAGYKIYEYTVNISP